MYTRCPACHTVHPLNAALMAQGNGRYRCGKCNKTVNALESLFDAWPAAGARPPGAGDLPVFGLYLDLAAARQARQEPESADLLGNSDGARPHEPNRISLRIMLVIAATAVIGLTLYLLAEFDRQPMAEQAAVRPVLETIGLKEEQPVQIFRDLGQIHLVSRELISEDPQSGLLRLNATIVNRANLRQPFPELEVTLLDTDGSVVGEYRLKPLDYLADKGRAGKGMTPHAFLPLSLQIEDPGVKAVSFELQFH